MAELPGKSQEWGAAIQAGQGRAGQGGIWVLLTFVDVCFLHCLSFPLPQPLPFQSTFYIL